MKHKFGLLPKVLLAIALGIVFGLFVPEWFTRIALTFNNIFGNFLNFVIPLLILGLVAPGIADLGSKAGRRCPEPRCSFNFSTKFCTTLLISPIDSDERSCIFWAINARFTLCPKVTNCGKYFLGEF